MPRDHTVPQMYLRRFATQRKNDWYTLVSDADADADAIRVNIKNVAVQSHFYTFTDEVGQQNRDLEALLGRIEALVTPVLTRILDDPNYALLAEWPLRTNLRERMAWFLAAQLVRTSRQRKRLEVLLDGPKLAVPTPIEGARRSSNEHVQFMLQVLGSLAHTFSVRPWALAHSGACLPTSDCPVMVLNGQDDENQLLAASFWDIAFPLDPHRLLYMPSRTMVEADPRKRTDHRVKLDGLGMAFVQAIFDTADRHVYSHPDHPGIRHPQHAGRLPAPGQPSNGWGMVISYSPLRPDETIEARWAREHPSR